MPDPRVNYRITAVDEVSKTVKAIDGKFTALSKNIKAIGGIAIGVAAGRELVRLGKAALAYGDRIDDLSKRTGIAASTLQAFDYAAGQTGASLDSLVGALTRLARSNDDATHGVSAAAEAFQRLGIDANALARLPLDQRMLVVADALSRVSSEGEQLALGQKLLGRGFAELLPLLKGGSDGLQKFVAEYQRLNPLTDEQIKALGEANDAWERLSTAFGNLGKIIVSTLGPALEGVANFLTEGIVSGAKVARNAIEDLTRVWTALKEERLFIGNKGFEIVTDLPKGPQGRRAAADPVAEYIRNAQKAGELNIAVPAPDVTAAIEAWEKMAKASKDAATEAAKDIERIIEQNRTPLEEYRVALDRITELQSRGLSTDVATREIQRLGAVLGEQTQAMVDATEAGQRWSDGLREAAEIAESVKTPFDRLVESYQKIARAEQSGLIAPDIAAKARQKALEELAATADQSATFAESRTDRMLESIKDAVDGYAKEITDIFFDTTKSIGDMFADLVNQISRMLVQRSIVEPLLGVITAGIGSLGGGLGTIDMSTLPKRRAMGGPVTAGSPFFVGEEGPELFIPRASGQIIPNGASIGGGNTTMNVTVVSPDPNAAASMILGQERLIVNMVRKAQVKAGYRPSL